MCNVYLSIFASLTCVILVNTIEATNLAIGDNEVNSEQIFHYNATIKRTEKIIHINNKWMDVSEADNSNVTIKQDIPENSTLSVIVLIKGDAGGLYWQYSKKPLCDALKDCCPEKVLTSVLLSKILLNSQCPLNKNSFNLPEEFIDDFLMHQKAPNCNKWYIELYINDAASTSLIKDFIRFNFVVIPDNTLDCKR